MADSLKIPDFGEDMKTNIIGKNIMKTHKRSGSTCIKITVFILTMGFLLMGEHSWAATFTVNTTGDGTVEGDFSESSDGIFKSKHGGTL